MYESPITQMIDDITTEMIHQQEDAIMVQIKQSVGYAIDKDELVKALQNDRNQYEKGFNDCMKLIDEIKAEINYVGAHSDYGMQCVFAVAVAIIDKHMERSQNGFRNRNDISNNICGCTG